MLRTLIAMITPPIFHPLIGLDWRFGERREEVAAIRALLVRYRALLYACPEESEADARYLRYTAMLGEVERMLSWSRHVPLQHRQSLMQALDWHYAKGDLRGGRDRLLIGPDFVEAIFEEAEKLEWLRLPPDTAAERSAPPHQATPHAAPILASRSPGT